VADQDVVDQDVADETHRPVEVAPSTPRMRSRAVASAARARRRRRWAIAVAIIVSFVAGVAVGSELTGGTASGVAVASGVAEPGPTTPSMMPPRRSASGGPGDRPSTVRTPTPTLDPARDGSVSGAASGSAIAERRRAPVQPSTTSASDRLHVPAMPGPHDLATPSGNIVCAYDAGVLDCQIGTGLVPVPDAACPAGGGAWAGVSLPSTGDAEPRCTPTPIEDRVAPERVLAYGERWERDGIACASGRDGLRCKNADGGELFLSRDRAVYGTSTATP
jgi:hypothetical protein